MKPIIRECFIDDSFAIQQLNSLGLGYDFPAEQTQQKLCELLASEKDKIFIAEVDGIVVGYSSIKHQQHNVVVPKLCVVVLV